MTLVSKERDCEFTFAVVIRNFGDPVKLRYKMARTLAKVVKMNFGDRVEVHIGTRAGNAVSWDEDAWPEGEA